MSNKKLEDLSLDDLLDMLDKTGDIIVSSDNLIDKSINRFIKEYNITSGQTKVPNYVIYYHYRRIWSKQGIKVTKIHFFRNFNKVFDSYRLKDTRYYMLNEGSFSLTEKDLKDAKVSDQTYRKKIKEKQKKRK